MNSLGISDDFMQPDSPNEDLSSYFNRSASAVQAYADRFEHVYARPALQASRSFYEEHPVTALFVAVFSALSTLPLLTFAGFSVFAVVFSLVIAVLSALLFSAGICAVSFFFLLFTLFAILCISIFITLLTLVTYTIYRLVILIRQGGRNGVSKWAQETRQSIAHAKSRVVRSIPLKYRYKARFGRAPSSSHNQSRSPHSQGFGTLSEQSQVPQSQQVKENGFEGSIPEYQQGDPSRRMSGGSAESAVIVKKEEAEEDASLTSAPGSYSSTAQRKTQTETPLGEKQDWTTEDTVPLLTQPDELSL